jgi:hypothetical protein
VTRDADPSKQLGPSPRPSSPKAAGEGTHQRESRESQQVVILFLKHAYSISRFACHRHFPG